MSAAPAQLRRPITVASAPYPWPYHGRLDPARTALVCCLDERWWRGGPSTAAAGDHLVTVARVLGGLGGGVVAVVPAARPGRAGAGPALPALLGSLEVGGSLEVVEAAGTSGFYASRLDGVLRAAGRRELVIAGWGLEGPVHSTLRAANDRGYECLLLHDACVAVEEGLSQAACSTVCMSGGIFGAVATTAQLLEALGTGSAAELAGAPLATLRTNDERIRG